MSIEWISNEHSLLLDDKEIGSMVYLGDTPKKGSSEELYYNSCIDVTLPIGKPDFKSDKLDYGEFLKYRDLTPDERATYLHWLASPRKSTQGRSDFVRLYVSGLEYRFFKDDSDIKEKREIYKEVQRLSRYYGGRIHLRYSFLGFLNTAQAMISPANYSPEFRGYNADRSLAATIAIGRVVANGEPVTAELSLAWWRWSPESRLGRTYYACEEEFPMLYKHLFNEKYPNGIVVEPPTKNLVDRYSANFGRFGARIKFEVNGKPIPDISDLQDTVETFQSIVDEAMRSLKKLGQYRYRKPKLQNALDEFTLVPASIRAKFHSFLIQELKRWLKAKTPNSHFTIKRLFEELQYKAPKNLTPSRYKDICDALTKLGFGLTPDPRVANPCPKFNEKILVFRVQPSENHTIAIGDKLLAGIMEISIGVFIAKTTGKMTSSKTKALEQVVGKKRMTGDLERGALTANLKWFLRNPPTESDFRKYLRKADERQKKSVRQTVITIAHATGVTDSKVIARVEQVYKLIGLDSVAAYSDLHAGQVVDQAKSGKRIESANASEKAKSRPGKRVKLDDKKIKVLSKETTEVSKLLNEVFGGESSPRIEPGIKKTITAKSTRPKRRTPKKKSSLANSVFKGLETEHIPLTLELLSKVRWTEKQVAKLAVKHGLMWQGSLEVINEWAFDTFGSELIEEYDGYQMNADTVGELSKRVQELKR